MPQDRKLYDKMRPPKYKGKCKYNFTFQRNVSYHDVTSGNATEVLFHVTVMSLDTIDESSMVRIHYLYGNRCPNYSFLIFRPIHAMYFLLKAGKITV